MIDELRKRTTVSAILLIGLFTFIFLGAEYLYVNMIALTAEARKAVNAQNYALGVSVAGFFTVSGAEPPCKKTVSGYHYPGISAGSDCVYIRYAAAFILCGNSHIRHGAVFCPWLFWQRGPQHSGAHCSGKRGAGADCRDSLCPGDFAAIFKQQPGQCRNRRSGFSIRFFSHAVRLNAVDTAAVLKACERNGTGKQRAK